MKFFMPDAETKEQEEKVYAALRERLSKELRASVADRKIFSLRFRYNGKWYSDEVGQPDPINQERVIAILCDEGNHLDYVWTRSSGGAGGTPMLVGARDVEAVADFDD